jgi:hypothetical protein
LHDGERAYRQVSLLAPEDFALQKHRVIFAAMRRIGDEVSPGAEAVAQALIESHKLVSVDGLAGLLDLHAKAIPGIHLEGFARKLREKSEARRALAITNTLVKSVEVYGINGNAQEIAAMAQELISLAEGVQQHATITSVADLPGVCASADPAQFMREPELPEGAIVALTGDSGSGKSTLATAWARDVIAAGRPVLILDRENPRTVAADRMARLGLQDGPLLRWWGGWTGDVPGPESLPVYRWVQSCDPAPLIIIDSLIAFLPGDENDASAMRGFMHGIRRLADRGATVVPIHHDGKSETARDFRGSSDFKASVDQAFHVSNLGSDGKLDRLSLRCFKSRYGFSGSLIYHYADGRMVRDERADAPARAVADELTQILRENPACSGELFEKLATAKGISRQRARNFLKSSSDGNAVHVDQNGNRRNYTLRSDL